MPTLEQNPAAVKALAELRRARVPGWLLGELENPPARGCGEDLHGWIFKRARDLHPHVEAESIAALLTLLCPEAEEREIADAVTNSAQYAWKPRNGQSWHKIKLTLPATHFDPRVTREREAKEPEHQRPPAAPKWPEPDTRMIRRIVQSTGLSLAGLEGKSRFEFSENQRWTAWLLQRLYPPDVLLCIATTMQSFATAPLAYWINEPVHACQFIVPSPMRAATGQTLQGKVSARTLDNVGERRFLIVESDAGLSFDEQAAVLWHLRQYLPLALAVHSGGKSLHGWFFVQGVPETDLHRLMIYARRLGADYAPFCRCQLVRLPDGTRQNKDGTTARQRVVYFEPEALQ